MKRLLHDLYMEILMLAETPPNICTDKKIGDRHFKY